MFFVKFFSLHFIGSSGPEVFCTNVALINFAKFTGKQLRQRLFFKKVAVYLKKSLAQVFSWEFYKISKNTFFIEQLRWLLCHCRVKQIRIRNNYCEYINTYFITP